MAFSGSNNFSATATDIVTIALRKCGVLGEGQTASLAQVEEYLLELNMLLHNMQVDGMSLWTVEDVYLWPYLELNDYKFNDIVEETNFGATEESSQRIRYRFTKEAGYFKTETASAAADNIVIPDKVVELISGDGVPGEVMAPGDILAWKDSNKQLKWETIQSVTNISGLTVAVVNSGVSGVTSVPVGQEIWFYRNLYNKNPKSILEAYCVTDSETGNNVPLDIISRQGYDSLSSFNNKGTANQIYVDETLPNTSISIWPQVDDESKYIKMRVQSPVDDLDTSGDTIYVEPEWYMAVALKLAELMAPDCGVPINQQYRLRDMAEMYYQKALDSDVEHGTSIQFVPENQAGRNF